MYSNEQYNKELLPALRPTMYKVLLFLDIPQQYLRDSRQLLDLCKGINCHGAIQRSLLSSFSIKPKQTG
jgi:hypothetical protein